MNDAVRSLPFVLGVLPDFSIGEACDCDVSEDRFVARDTDLEREVEETCSCHIEVYMNVCLGMNCDALSSNLSTDGKIVLFASKQVESRQMTDDGEMASWSLLAKTRSVD